jgi:predicted RNA-binding Zn-ribbon protein involved in translation (DUF1610 family)
MEMENSKPDSEIYKCDNCGGNLKFVPGTQQNKCESCNSLKEIIFELKEIPYKNYETFIAKNGQDDSENEVQIISCTNCGAEIQFDANIVAGECSFCTTPLNITQTSRNRKIKPEGIIPFQIEQIPGYQKYSDWINSRWFAPNDLKKNIKNPDKLSGIYIPFWVFSCKTSTVYEGYKIVKRNKSTSRYFKKGKIDQDFLNLDTVASAALPKKNVDLLEPWDWNKLVPYTDSFALGFKTECYTINLQDGNVHAKDKMKEIITRLVKKEIGGDRQEINFMETAHSEMMFKHVLLPVWLSSFKYKGKLYRFVINGQSGEVQGERPYSKWKIAVFILFFFIALVPMGYFWVNGPALYRTIFAVLGILELIILFKIAIKGFEIDISKKINPYSK